MSTPIPADLHERVRCLYKQATENLTLVQTRCTSLLQEVRALRWLAGTSPVESRVLADVVHERRLQDQKWGPIDQQVDIPDATGSKEGTELTCGHFGYASMLANLRHWVSLYAQQGMSENDQPLMLVLAEEVLEAGCETDPSKLRAELVQVAAVAVKWISILDMRRAREEKRVQDPNIELPGWWCEACGGYNGKEKLDRPACRSCGAKQPGFGMPLEESLLVTG